MYSLHRSRTPPLAGVALFFVSVLLLEAVNSLGSGYTYRPLSDKFSSQNELYVRVSRSLIRGFRDVRHRKANQTLSAH
jgi:hypothetical protein